MNTTQLECFLAVAKQLNFSKAAEAIKITQPAVSRQICSLEAELGVKLFSRTSKKVDLTVSGLQFIEDAREIIKIAATARARYRSHLEQAAPVPFEIGCHDQYEQTLIPPILSALLKRHPQIRPSIKIAPPQVIENRLAEQKLDVLLSFEHRGQYHHTAAYHELTTCPIACICSENHPFAGYRQLAAEDLTGTYIVCDPNMAYHSFPHHNRMTAQSAPAEVYFADGLNTAVTLIKSGIGFILYPDIPYSREADLCYIPVPELPAVSFGLFTANEKNKPLVREFIAIARDFFAAQGADNSPSLNYTNPQ